MRNAYHLKWLRPRVVFSRHSNLQEKLLADLRWKVLWGVVDADLGPQKCNSPARFKIKGECAYGGDESCWTAGTVYNKISCKHNNDTCNCFYIGKSQRYIKTRVQEHIGEVTKLYDKYILCLNRNATSPQPNSQATRTTHSSRMISQATQDFHDLPEPSQSPLTCVIIEDVPSPPPEPRPMLNLCSQPQPSDNESTINEPANDGPPQRISIVDNQPVANTTTTNNLEARHKPNAR
jgi:hypothetical protein